MPKGSLNVSLKGADDIFSTEESRQEQQREQVQQIPIGELFPFKNHPFKVLDDESMQRTVESVEQYGVLSPLIARPRPEGGYEIISGHRRQHAAQLAGLDALLPTKSMANADLAALPAGEWKILRLIAARLLCAVGEPHRYAETSIITICAGEEFSAKGKLVLSDGWKAMERKMLGELLGKQKEAVVLPDAQEQSQCSVAGAELKEGQTSPPKHFTEDAQNRKEATMSSKTEEYLALAQRTANGLTRYWESWTDYLTTASRLYKYSFPDQLMIYAQRPDATACADYDIWNTRINRYVRRGSKGIALLDESSGSTSNTAAPRAAVPVAG